jgi:predicted Zn-dependent protease
LLLAPFRSLCRRPGRALGVLALLVLIGLAAGVAGLFLWFDHHLAAARRAVERRHNGPAIEHLRACRRLRPDHPEVLLLSARTARCSGAVDEAELLLDRSWQLYGDEEETVLERLLLRAARGELESTAPLLQGRIDRDDPAAPLAREALVAGLLHRFRLNEADRQLHCWRAHDPASTTALLWHGKLAEEREQNSEALLAYRSLLELDPEHDEARLRLTTILVHLRQGSEALPHLEYLHRRLPDSAEVLVQLAQALDLLGRPGEARAALDNCLRRHPDDPAALAERGRIARRDGDSRQAEEDLHRAVRLDPGNLAAHYQYHLALGQNRKKEEAATELDAIHKIEADVQRIQELVHGRLQQTPDDPALHHEIALIALRAGLPKQAHRWLRSALQLDPNHLLTHRALAVYYHQIGNPILSARHRALAQRLSSQPGRK